MSISFMCRQSVTLLRVLAEHMGSDPVFFGVQVSRRLPGTISNAVGRGLRRLPSTVSQTAGQWLTGDAAGAEQSLRQQLSADHLSDIRARVFGEFALSLRMRREAGQFADRIRRVHRARSLRARIEWQAGRMTEAIGLAEEERLQSRLQGEAQVFQPGWRPTLPQKLPEIRSPKADVLFALTNSLPHTQSGYTLRSHAVLTSLQRRGVRVIGATRTGYPVSVGRFSWSGRDWIDDIAYLRDIPWNQGRTMAQRLSKQAEFTAALAAASGTQVIHTTSHFVNGAAAAAAARKLNLPWVYEVRGVLEETWAASAGSPEERKDARQSERYRLFRARETEIALEADRVVTLGSTMAAELISRGIPRERILVAPNAVSSELLRRDADRPPSAVRAENGLPTGGIWVGTAASIVGYEGLDILIDAVAEARRAGTDLRVMIVGDGVELPALRQRAESLGDAAVFTGRVAQQHAHELITALDIFAVPRRDDPVCSLVTPLKPVEAGGLARPVVLSDLPALTEALPAEAHSTVAPGDVTRWAEELSRLAEDEQTRRDMGCNGRRFVEQHRTWDAVGRAYTDMYRELGVGGLT